MNAYDHLMEKVAAQAVARGVGAMAGKAIKTFNPANLRATYQTARGAYKSSPWAQVAARFTAVAGGDAVLNTLARLKFEARKRAREAGNQNSK